MAGDRIGLVACPDSCGQTVRLTRNPMGRAVLVNVVADARGNQAAWFDGAVWRSRQLHQGESVTEYEARYMIHKATCWRYLRAAGRSAGPPQLAVAPPPPGPINPELAAKTREQLEQIRQRRRGDGGAIATRGTR